MMAQAMTERVTIQEPLQVRDPVTGSVSTSWVTWMVGGAPMQDVPAAVLTGPGREPQQAGSRRGEADLRVSMHYLPGLTQRHRVIWRGEPYGVVSVELDASNRRVVRLLCRRQERDQ